LSGDLTGDEYQGCLAAHIAMLDGMIQVSVDPRVLITAGAPFPMPVRSLDALHVASALAYQQEFETPQFTFLTHDRKQAELARAMGMNVKGV
jgi:hypothetical protein